MENTNSRGQCALELVLVLILLTSAILIIQQFADQTRHFLSSAVLSREVR